MKKGKCSQPNHVAANLLAVWCIQVAGMIM